MESTIKDGTEHSALCSTTNTRICTAVEADTIPTVKLVIMKTRN